MDNAQKSARLELLTLREFAQEVRVIPETVRRWVRSGKVQPAGRTPAGHYRFAREQVAEVLGQGSRPSQTARAKAIEGELVLQLEIDRCLEWAQKGA